MKMQIGKWGNSLAVRLPRDVVDALSLKEGDVIESEVFTAAVTASKRAAAEARRRAALDEIAKGRFDLPPDWKFDRDEANWRPALDRW